MKTSTYTSLAFFCLIIVALCSQDALAKNTTLNDKAYLALQQGQYTEAYKLSIGAEKQANKLNNNIELARAYSNQAANLSYLGDYQRAIELYKKSEALARKEKNIDGVLRAINNLAEVYTSLGDHSESLAYKKEHEKLSLATQDPTEILVSYVGLVNFYISINKFSNAKLYLERSKKILNQLNDDFLLVYYLLADADYWENNNNLKKSIELLNKALKIAIDNNYRGLVVSIKSNIAECLVKQQKYTLAADMALSSLEEAKKLKLKSKQQQLNDVLANVFKKTGNYKLALHHRELSQQLSDLIIGEKVQMLGEITSIERKVKDTQTKLTTSQNKRQILSLQLKEQSKNQMLVLVLLIAFASSAFLFYYRVSSKKEIKRQKEVNKRLKELDRVKDRILKNTSHELRTPLNGIIGLSEVIIENNKNVIASETLDMVSLIKNSGEQLSIVINDILDMSKSQSSEITIINANFNLSELIKDVIAVCYPLANEKNLNIQFLQTDQVQEVFLDKTRLQQVLFNIIGNAVKFTEQGGVDVKYSVEEYGIKLEITDTGIGIPNEKIERITEGFEQVDSGDTRENSGSGLGLAISRNISQALGGSLKISSKLNKGTRVIISLPFAT